MRRWMVVVAISAWGVHAEQWADEPAVAPAPEPVEPPLVGLIAGAELAVGPLTNEGPALGVRLGARFRVAPHVSLGVLFDWQVVSWFTGTPGAEEVDHYASGLLLLELFSLSAFEHLLVPELSVGVLGGTTVVLWPSGAHLWGQVGLHAGLTRLRPSGWWFPFFAEVLYLFGEQGGFTQLVVGVGL